MNIVVCIPVLPAACWLACYVRWLSVIDMLIVLAAAVSCAIDTQTGALLLDPDTSEEKVTCF